MSQKQYIYLISALTYVFLCNTFSTVYLNSSRVGLTEFQADGVSTLRDNCTEHKSRNIQKPQQTLNKLLAAKLYPQSLPHSRGNSAFLLSVTEDNTH